MRSMIKLLAWYRYNVGVKAENTIFDRMQHAVEALAEMPTIGVKCKEMNGRQYRSFVEHSKCKILYYCDDEVLYIVDLIFTQMNS